MKKYEITDIIQERLNGPSLYRIRALREIPNYGVKPGDLGGWVESEKNLSQEGDCWVSDEAKILHNAYVRGDALVADNAAVTDNSIVDGIALLTQRAMVGGYSRIGGLAMLDEHAYIYGRAIIHGMATITGKAHIGGDAVIYGDAYICNRAHITQGHYNGNVMTVNLNEDYNITANYPNHVYVGCYLIEICDKDKFIKILDEYSINPKYNNLIWAGVQTCKQWLKDNPEPKEES